MTVLGLLHTIRFSDCFVLAVCGMYTDLRVILLPDTSIIGQSEIEGHRPGFIKTVCRNSAIDSSNTEISRSEEFHFGGSYAK